MRTKVLRALLASVVGIASLTLAAVGPANAADTGESGDSRTVGGVEVSTSFGVATQRQLDRLLASSAAKVVTLDAASGAVLSVEAPPLVSTFGYDGTICDSTDLCLLASSAPYPNAAFSGTGTFSGSWDKKSAYRTGNRYGKLWWLYGFTPVEGAKLGPNTTSNFTAIVTVTKVQRTTS